MGEGEDDRTLFASPMDEEQLSETKLVMDHLGLLQWRVYYIALSIVCSCK